MLLCLVQAVKHTSSSEGGTDTDSINTDDVEIDRSLDEALRELDDAVVSLNLILNLLN